MTELTRSKWLPIPAGSIIESGFTTFDPTKIGITISPGSLSKDGFGVYGLRVPPTAFGHVSYRHKAKTMNNPVVKIF